MQARLQSSLPDREISGDWCAAQVDTVRYGVAGWKDRYYQSKLGLPRGDPSARAVVVGHYVKGLCWVLMYYYQGVQVRSIQTTPCVMPIEMRASRPVTRAHTPFAQDWGWYYPYHYAPCASDLVNLSDFAGGQFEIGSPFRHSSSSWRCSRPRRRTRCPSRTRR